MPPVRPSRSSQNGATRGRSLAAPVARSLLRLLLVAAALNVSQPLDDTAQVVKGVPSNTKEKPSGRVPDSWSSACTAGTLMAVAGSAVNAPVLGAKV